ncbi:MAG: glycoside hydrolase family 97 N-terminal domain-containing protein, partial [Anaerohalosphaera sp.]|nr:glycoside hydrolase family 97 N-terminal domain-containing protein [Anaerohalosphaera sp.]
MLRLHLVTNIMLLFSTVVCGNSFVLTTLTNPKAITVVEAEQSYDASGNGPSNPIVLGLNTVPYDGVDRQIAFDGDTSWMSNDMWGGRSGWTAGGLLDDGVWHSDHNNGHGKYAPTITTQIEVPLGSFEVYVVYCAADPEDLSTHHGGMVKARLHDPGDATPFDTYGSEGNTLGLTEGEGTGVDAVAGWSIVVASLGNVSNTSSLAIDVANDTRRIGDASRNIYIGIGYRALSCENQAPLIELGDEVFVEMNVSFQLTPVVTDDGKPYMEGCDAVDTEQGTSVGMLYEWSVVDPANAESVTFDPDSQRKDPNITFTQCGDIDLKLQVWDDKDGQSPSTGAQGGKTSSGIAIFHVNCPPDCEQLRGIGLTLPADISGPDGKPDCYVNLSDLLAVAAEWLGVPVVADIFGMDMQPDNEVNLYDMLLLAQQWMDCIDPLNAGCDDAYQLLRATSPDGDVAVQFKIKSKEGVGNGIYWSVAYKGETVLDESQLGFDLQDSVPLESGFKLVDFQQTSHNSSWSPVYGERSSIRDNYQQLQVTVEDDQVPVRRMQLTFRAYDEGAAFKVTFPEQEAFDQITINQENTQFSFTDDHWAWAVYSAQGVYAKKQLSAIGSNCERPLTVKVRDDLYLSVLEAGLVDYARMKLKEHATLPNTLVS